MKKVKLICWISSGLLLFLSTYLVSYALEADQRTTSGQVSVLLPDTPQDIPEVKPLAPLVPDQPLIFDDSASISDKAPDDNATKEPAITSSAMDEKESLTDTIAMPEFQKVLQKGTRDWLSISYAPSSFTFKLKQQLTTKTTTVYADLLQLKDTAENKQVTWPNYLQITDERGRGSGWTLSVKQETEFSRTDSKNVQQVLAGAQLSLGTPTGKAELLGLENNDRFQPSKVAEMTTLMPQVAADLIVAQQDQGLGTWLYRFGNATTMNKGISLTIPAHTDITGGYSALLNWSIVDAPVA